nr:MAG TPA: hypothetical protein [Caudoviricetes sp.]
MKITSPKAAGYISLYPPLVTISAFFKFLMSSTSCGYTR